MMQIAPSIAEFLQRIRSARDLPMLAAIEQECFGRKNGSLTVAFQALHTLAPAERKAAARRLNEGKTSLLHAIAARRGELQNLQSSACADDRLDVTLELPPPPRGHLHPIPEFMDHAEEVFGRMGFDVAYGPEIETEEHQFDLLNFPREHAARDAQDIFFLSLPGSPRNRSLLRGHTSPVQIHYMRTHQPPFRMICPGKVYRRDDDATHSPMFHQVEGLMIDRDISLANMKAVMIAAVRELISPNVAIRFRTGYFPFVEPGLEMDMRWQSAACPPKLEERRGELRRSGDGPVSAELRRSGDGWMEIAGCGMVHPNVLRNCGINVDETSGRPGGRPRQSRLPWQGFAFGFGVERMLMIKHRIPDIRLFTGGDLRFLEQF